MHKDRLQVKLMNLTPCRDCGNMIDPSSRGCSTCALNLDAERMIDRFVWRRLVPAVIILAVLFLAAFFYLYR